MKGEREKRVNKLMFMCARHFCREVSLRVEGCFLLTLGVLEVDGLGLYLEMQNGKIEQRAKVL